MYAEQHNWCNNVSNLNVVCVCILVLKYRRQVLVLVVLRPQTHPNVMLLFHSSSCQRRLHVFFLGLDLGLDSVLTLVLISTPLLGVLVVSWSWWTGSWLMSWYNLKPIWLSMNSKYSVSVSQFLSHTGVYWIQSNSNTTRTPVVILRLLEICEISLLPTYFCYLFIYLFGYWVIYLFISTMPAAALELTLRTLTSSCTCFLISYYSVPASSGVRGTFFFSLPAFSLPFHSAPTYGGKPPPIFVFL